MQTVIGKWLHEQDGFGVIQLDTITAIFWVFVTAGVVTTAITFFANMPLGNGG